MAFGSEWNSCSSELLYYLSSSLFECYFAVRNLNSQLLQLLPEPFGTFSLLDVLARSQETLEQLENIRTNEKGGNIALGIGKIIGSRLSGISSGSSHIIKPVGSALHGGRTGIADLDEKVITSFGKATINIIDSSGRAFEHVSSAAVVCFFHDVLGGLSGSLLRGALLLLTIFCLSVHTKPTYLLSRQERHDIAHFQ